jgi:hypothetical protein
MFKNSTFCPQSIRLFCTEIGRCYGMEMNVGKNKSNENLKTTIPSNNYDRPKTTGECGMF